MKYLVLILFAIAVHMIIAQEEDSDYMATKLSRVFMISHSEAKKCVEEMELTPGELWILNDTAFDDVDPHNSTIKKIVCTLTCCAQAQGTMIGAVLQLPVIHNLIQISSMPPYMKPIFHKFVDECAIVVKGLTDECIVGYAFIKCMTDKPWDDVPRESERK